jgi:hypothetical protein
MNQEPALNQNAEDENNPGVKSAKGYQSHGYSLEESNFEDENNRQVKSVNGYQSQGDEDNINPWETDRFADGYQENIVEINFGDTPYTESAINPNPKLPGYGSGSGYKSKKSQQSTSPELEL